MRKHKVQEAMNLLRRMGWEVKVAPSGLHPLGVAVIGHRPGRPAGRKMICPECGGSLEATAFLVNDRERLGTACVDCGYLGFLEELPEAYTTECRLFSLVELEELLQRHKQREFDQRREGLLEEALERVRKAPAGSRNVILSQEAARVGEILSRHPVWTTEEAIERLVQAAMEAGLNPREARSVARRQVAWGNAQGIGRLSKGAGDRR